MIPDQPAYYRRSFILEDVSMDVPGQNDSEIELGSPALHPQYMEGLETSGLPKLRSNSDLFATEDDNWKMKATSPKVHEVVPEMRVLATQPSPQPRHQQGEITLDEDKNVTLSTFYHPSQSRQSSTHYPPSVQSALDDLDNSVQAHSLRTPSESSAASRTQAFVYDRTLIERTTSEMEESDPNQNRNWKMNGRNHPNKMRDQTVPLPKAVRLTCAQKLYFLCMGFSTFACLFVVLFLEPLQESFKDDVLPKTGEN